MEIFRKIMLAVGIASFCICGLYLNGMGGAAIIVKADEKYARLGVCLLVSTVLFGGTLGTAFSRKGILNVISLLLNAAATVLWIYPLACLNGVPNSVVEKTRMEVLTNRIYPAVIITISLGLAVFADFFSYERITKRAEKRERKMALKNRPLNENEKII